MGCEAKIGRPPNRLEGFLDAWSSYVWKRRNRKLMPHQYTFNSPVDGCYKPCCRHLRPDPATWVRVTTIR